MAINIQQLITGYGIGFSAPCLAQLVIMIVMMIMMIIMMMRIMIIMMMRIMIIMMIMGLTLDSWSLTDHGNDEDEADEYIMIIIMRTLRNIKESYHCHNYHLHTLHKGG